MVFPKHQVYFKSA